VYIDNGNDDKIFHIPKGRLISGYTIGILHLDVWYPLLPGNVVNAYTYDFPVRMKEIPNAVQSCVHGGDPTLVDDIISAGKKLEREGVRAICGACGYLGNFQSQVAEALDVPVLLSSLVQVPMIKATLKKKQKVGVLCADGPSLTPAVLQNCGVDPSICVIKGMGDQPHFSAILKSNKGHFDNTAVKKEVVEGASSLVNEHPEIGAILLECSDMPPYSADVQNAVNLPVFDFITMIKWAHSSVTQKPYHGFI
jgi:aspartate/glutamate racemase